MIALRCGLGGLTHANHHELFIALRGRRQEQLCQHISVPSKQLPQAVASRGTGDGAGARKSPTEERTSPNLRRFEVWEEAGAQLLVHLELSRHGQLRTAQGALVRMPPV